MTETQARRHLKAWRLEHGWSYDELSADINLTLGAYRVSMQCLRRFIRADTKRPRDTTLHDIATYLHRKDVAA